MIEPTERSAGGDSLQQELIAKLRQANAHLVVATMRAQELQAAAEATSARQEEFLGMLAHELRNPLAPVAMAGELLGLITDAHPLLPGLQGTIARQTKHLIRLVEDLLDASRINSGKITLKKSISPFSEIIDSAIETSQPFISKRSQQLTLESVGGATLFDADLVRLSQVFSNLLINAAKFTPEHGHIEVSVRLTDSVARVSIKDNGMGIAIEAQPFIFDLFTQGPPPLDSVQNGLGIGLSLARTVVQLHGGTIAVHSEGAGFGSEFVVLLPVSPSMFPVPGYGEQRSQGSPSLHGNVVKIISMIKPH